MTTQATIEANIANEIFDTNEAIIESLPRGANTYIETQILNAWRKENSDTLFAAHSAIAKKYDVSIHAL